jgi:uncharacterized protein (DUF779 family)
LQLKANCRSFDCASRDKTARDFAQDDTLDFVIRSETAEFAEVAMVVVPEQVIATPAAVELMSRLAEKHGELMFHQSGGCCDGSSPMCYPRGEFLTGDSDVLMATLGETPFYMSRSQFEYWKHTQLILDVVPGRGGMFSLENGEGVRFLIRSRVFTDQEIGALRAAGRI